MATAAISPAAGHNLKPVVRRDARPSRPSLKVRVEEDRSVDLTPARNRVWGKVIQVASKHWNGRDMDWLGIAEDNERDQFCISLYTDHEMVEEGVRDEGEVREAIPNSVRVYTWTGNPTADEGHSDLQWVTTPATLEAFAQGLLEAVAQARAAGMFDQPASR
jgi:hypothetical protein